MFKIILGEIMCLKELMKTYFLYLVSIDYTKMLINQTVG